VDEVEGGAGLYGAALLFVAWAEGAERPVGHLETAYLTFGVTPEAAEAPLLALPLADIKAQLDACVAGAR
jgi:hypothetical protein